MLKTEVKKRASGLFGNGQYSSWKLVSQLWLAQFKLEKGDVDQRIGWIRQGLKIADDQSHALLIVSGSARQTRSCAGDARSCCARFNDPAKHDPHIGQVC